MCAVVFIFFQKKNVETAEISLEYWVCFNKSHNVNKTSNNNKNFVVSFISGFNTQCAADAMFGIFAKL